MKCKLCYESIPPNHVQQGGLCMRCVNKDIDVWRVTLIEDNLKGGYYEKDASNILEAIKDMDNDSSYVITKEKMKAGIYFNLPEFEGF